MKTATPTTTVTFRRLNPDAPVGLRADACLSLRSRHTECDRCVEACPAGALHRGEEIFFLDAGCLGCGRCAAVCPMGALAVAGFTLRPTEIKATRPLTLDCWKVPAAASPPHGVRVPCLGGLSPGQWLGLVLAARGHGVELLDRGWCSTCPASPGAAHPAAATLAVVHGWLKEARVPRQHWPRRVRAPLPATRAATPDPRNETPVSRRRFFGALVHESVGLANTALGAPRVEERHRRNGAGIRRTENASMADARAPAASPERERVLVFLAALAASRGGGVPASLYPAIAISADCRNHRLCAALCPTGALRPYVDDGMDAGRSGPSGPSRGITPSLEGRGRATPGAVADSDNEGIAYDATRCIACGQCESACPEQAVRLQPAGPGADTAVALTRHATRICAACGERFAAGDRKTLCPTCRKSRAFAQTAFKTLFANTANQGEASVVRGYIREK